MGRSTAYRPALTLDRPGLYDWDADDAAAAEADPSAWHVEPKLDGMWGQLICDGATGEVWSQHGRYKATLDLPRPAVGRSVLHGEWLAGSHWAHRAGLDQTLHLFDVTVLDGVDVSGRTVEERRRLLVEAVAALGLDTHPQVHIVPRWSGAESAELWRTLVIEQGYEGLVYKRAGCRWGEGWARRKRVHTMDYVCVGINEGGGKHAGRGARSIQAGLYQPDGTLEHIGNVSGLTTELRRDMYARPDHYIGRVFEARGRGVYQRGTLRHPAFVRWRPDYDPRRCVPPVSSSFGAA